MSSNSKKIVTSSSAFSQPLIHSSLTDTLIHQTNQPQLPLLMDNTESHSLFPNHIPLKNDHPELQMHGHSLPTPNTQHESIFNVDDSFTIQNDSLLAPETNIKKRTKRNRHGMSFAPKLRAPWNENVKDLLLRKLRNRRDTNSIRYIRRDFQSKSNVFSLSFMKQRGYTMMYHKLIDRPWLILICELFLIYTAIYVFFATLFYYTKIAYNDSNNPEIIHDYKHNYWFLCFNFAVHTGTTIGYGFLLPKDISTILSGFTMLMLVYSTEIFETLFIGVLIKKIKKPTRLGTQIRFSDCAVINRGYSTTRQSNTKSSIVSTSLKFQPRYARHKYSDFDVDCGTIHDAGSYNKSTTNDKYLCLMFRFCHVRPRSRMCMPTMNLFYYQHHIINDNDNYSNKPYVIDWMKHKHQELDYEIFRKQGRMRSDSNDVPFLSLPWTVVHKIDETSPLYGLSKQDLANNKVEIIAVVGGIDEITSDNFQKWWSFTVEEIYWNHQFEPMVKTVLKYDQPWYCYLLCCFRKGRQKAKEMLEINFDRLSLISPITRHMYT